MPKIFVCREFASPSWFYIHNSQSSDRKYFHKMVGGALKGRGSWVGVHTKGRRGGPIHSLKISVRTIIMINSELTNICPFIPHLQNLK